MQEHNKPLSNCKLQIQPNSCEIERVKKKKTCDEAQSLKEISQLSLQHRRLENRERKRVEREFVEEKESNLFLNSVMAHIGQ